MGTFSPPWNHSGATLDPKCPHKGSKELVTEPNEKTSKNQGPQNEIGGRVLDLWWHGKSGDSKISIAKHWGKRQSGEVGFPRAVGKGGLLRGKGCRVALTPLRPGLKREGQSLTKKGLKLGVSLALPFFLAWL